MKWYENIQNIFKIALSFFLLLKFIGLMLFFSMAVQVSYALDILFCSYCGPIANSPQTALYPCQSDPWRSVQAHKPSSMLLVSPALEGTFTAHKPWSMLFVSLACEGACKPHRVALPAAAYKEKWRPLGNQQTIAPRIQVMKMFQDKWNNKEWQTDIPRPQL